MKKSIIALFLALGFVAGSDAFASRARLLVEGTGDGGQILDATGGSFYVDDAYNMFYNPSYINDYKDWGIIERSNGNSATTSTQLANAMGGFVTSMMNMNVGFFFNRTGSLTQDSLTTTSGGTKTVGSDMRPIDIIVGGEHGGMKWGASATYARYKLETATDSGTSQDLNLRVGGQFEGLDPFISYRLAGSERGYSGATFVSQVHKDFMIGTKYHWGEWTPYAAWRWSKTGALTTNNAFGIGFGRDTKVAEGVKLRYAVGGWHNVNNGSSKAVNTIPIDLSVEGDVASWLALRGGLNYRLWNQTGNNTADDATQGALGATFKFGKLAVDWAVGAGTANSGGTSGDGTLNSSTFGFDGGFFTATSVQYSW